MSSAERASCGDWLGGESEPAGGNHKKNQKKKKETIVELSEMHRIVRN